ncbi:hypothetical protein [Pseudomonas sp. TUM22785]|uniref:hypothetical protein n=1 Tax=Pseudomonas sp. TUM22785 TaxID=3019098 RepID=UPI00230537BF|nr:hypothetical protein [Pseudomonas sp. TUM22785]WCD79136.1 hypothetical protein PI990_24545 [Pseudomonas sp. TUM22785]
MQKTYTYKLIATIQQTAPLLMTVPDHGLPGEWMTWAEGIQGGNLNLDKLTSVGRMTRVIDADTVEFNDINGRSLRATGGDLVYQLPVDLTGMGIRAVIRGEGADPIVLTLGAGLTVIGLGQLLLELTPEQTAAIGWTRGEWDLDLTYTDGRVERWLRGEVVVSSGGGCCHG